MKRARRSAPELYCGAMTDPAARHVGIGWRPELAADLLRALAAALAVASAPRNNPMERRSGASPARRHSSLPAHTRNPRRPCTMPKILRALALAWPCACHQENPRFTLGEQTDETSAATYTRTI